MTAWSDFDEDGARRDPAVRLQPALQLAIEDIKPALLSLFQTWRQIPHIQLSSAAFAARMQAVTTGQKARVDFKRIFARFIKTRFPDYPVAADTGELFRCVKPLNEHLALGIDWRHRAAWGLGKILEVQVGARWDNKSATSFHPLSTFFGSADAVSWAYIAKEDLEACFDGAAQFLDALLPLLAEALPKRMAEGVDLGGAGPIGAREGYEIAQRLVEGLAAAADPARPTAGMDLQSLFMMPGSGRRWGAMFSPDGRLRAHGTWAYSFKGRAGEGARVHVPSLGDPWIDYQAGWTVPGELIGEAWMDSPDAMAAIAASGRMLEGVTPTELSLGYYPPYTEGPSWRIDAWIVGKGIRNVILVDARDGRVVWAHP